ncbi:hypothetical protein STVA_30800 [Allostella vacuolata]|nr:hypothetical protein STVA_30800 [Stella vacuolata]
MPCLRLLALTLTAIALVPSAAHLLEMPAKMGLDREEYFLVQGIYAGWSWFAVPILGAIVANLALFVGERRRERAAARMALVAAVLVALSLAIFFLWVFPGNQATANWTTATDDWQSLRRRWEYGHAGGAILVFAAFLATALATTWPGRDRRSRRGDAP